MNRKRFLTFIAVILLAVISAGAQIKSYYDWNNGYSGSAGATYVGTTKNIDPQDFAAFSEQSFRQKRNLTVTRQLQKISKAENFLLWSAIWEYDIQDGEIFSIYIHESNAIDSLTLVVSVANNKQSLYYYNGFYWHSN